MTLPRLPVADRFTVEQYLDGQWYVINLEFPFRQPPYTRLLFGPYKSEFVASEVYLSLVESYKKEWCRW